MLTHENRSKRRSSVVEASEDSDGEDSDGGNSETDDGAGEEDESKRRRDKRRMRGIESSHESSTPSIRNESHQDDGDDLTDLKEGATKVRRTRRVGGSERERKRTYGKNSRNKERVLVSSAV